MVTVIRLKQSHSLYMNNEKLRFEVIMPPFEFQRYTECK